MPHQFCDELFFFPDSTFENKIPQDTFEDSNKSFQCPACSACFSSAAILRKHELLKNIKVAEPIILLDEERGIFVTAQDKPGPRIIIDMCKSFNRQAIDSEVDSCREFMAMATGRECVYLDRLQHFKPHVSLFMA